jgi:hypothetical protein
MKYINMYLIGYAVLLIGIALALWKSGVMAHVSPAWVAIGVVIAIGVGVMLAVGSGKPAITRD